MGYRSEYGGVTFDEGDISGMSRICDLDTKLNSGFGFDQLKSLNDLKEKMANEAKACGGNCVSNFKYGQRNGSFWQQILSVDNVLWYGSGVIGKMET